MTEYLTKKQYDAVNSIFSWIREKLDVNKKICFEMLSANVRNSKYGYQEQKIETGFKEFQSDLEDEDQTVNNEDQTKKNEKLTVTNNNEIQNELLQSENPSIYESDREFIELNKNLKEGKSGTRGVTLGDESLQNNARFVISNENNLVEFDKNDKNKINLIQEDFQSFEIEKKNESKLSNQTNSLFKNLAKEEDEKNLIINKKTSTFNNEESGVSSEIMQIGLSFGNESFTQNINIDPEKEMFRRTSFGSPISGSRKSQENESGIMSGLLEIGVDGTRENFLNSQTFGKKSLQISMNDNINEK